jgi:hypothetical protein
LVKRVYGIGGWPCRETDCCIIRGAVTNDFLGVRDVSDTSNINNGRVFMCLKIHLWMESFHLLLSVYSVKFKSFLAFFLFLKGKCVDLCRTYVSCFHILTFQPIGPFSRIMACTLYNWRPSKHHTF